MIRKITMIGAGRLASRLATELKERGFEFVQVCNRSEERGKRLADLMGAKYTDDLSSLEPADLYIICIADSALPDICSRMKDLRGIVTHTSGTINMNAISGCSKHVGVIYPPQSFTLNSAVSFTGLTICVEGSDTDTEKDLAEVAKRISGKVAIVNSEQRLWLHLAAAFASNFPNYLYSVAEKLIENSGLNMETLLPLIMETASHARAEDIFSMQTGPAIREDKIVIDKHLELLTNFPEYQEIYRILTSAIINHKHRNDKL